uniref:Uncharacterized protein n=4 Tax=Methanobacteriati TaxID=3366610 RepID=A0A075HBZ0_9EURY|nr:hypothetical protein [uncultured marine group II/III euryarchaeote KM3_51_F05]AIF18389.1 hypothetical protein [uncultured marine group II/III euryarchaeote KM3_82_E01]
MMSGEALIGGGILIGKVATMKTTMDTITKASIPFHYKEDAITSMPISMKAALSIQTKIVRQFWYPRTWISRLELAPVLMAFTLKLMRAKLVVETKNRLQGSAPVLMEALARWWVQLMMGLMMVVCVRTVKTNHRYLQYL